MFGRMFASDRVKILRGRLRLVNVTAEDNGIYSCVGRNVAGQVDSADNFLLNVAGSHRFLPLQFFNFLIIKQLLHLHFCCVKVRINERRYSSRAANM